MCRIYSWLYYTRQPISTWWLLLGDVTWLLTSQNNCETVLASIRHNNQSCFVAWTYFKICNCIGPYKSVYEITQWNTETRYHVLRGKRSVWDQRHLGGGSKTIQVPCLTLVLIWIWPLLTYCCYSLKTKSIYKIDTITVLFTLGHDSGLDMVVFFQECVLVWERVFFTFYINQI